MKIISCFFSFVFAVVFYLILLIFHVIQWIALKFGYQYHKISVDWLNWFLMKSLLLLGNTFTFKKHYPIPRGVSIIFISNHQSMFDIPPIIWYMRKYHPKFVSKIQLGRGIPSVSFNLRHWGAALINRKDPKQSLSTLENFGKTIDRNTWSAVIFPEGTRSRNGQPKKFALNGLKMIIKNNPEAYIVPVTINNSWKVFKYGKFPLGMFNSIKIESFKPIHLRDTDTNEALLIAEQMIKENIKPI